MFNAWGIFVGTFPRQCACMAVWCSNELCPFGRLVLGGWQGIGHETIVVIDPHFGSRFIKLENHPKNCNLLYLSCFFQAFFWDANWLTWFVAEVGLADDQQTTAHRGILAFRWWSSQQWTVGHRGHGSLSSGKTWHLYCEVVATTGACWTVEGCEDWKVEVGLSISQNMFLFFGCIYVALCFRR